MRESFSVPEPGVPAPTLTGIIGGRHQPIQRGAEEKEMKKQWFGGIVGLGALLIVAGGAYPAAGGNNNSSTDDRPVMEAAGSPSFGTEDWIGPEEQAPVVAVQPPSFGTEDWIGPEEQAPIVAVKSPSLGTEDWTGTMESSEAVGTGAIPEPAPENLDLDDYNPD